VTLPAFGGEVPGRLACRRIGPADHGASTGLRRIARRSITAKSLLATLSLASATSLAQESDLEELIVTGSRIARPDFTTASPIVSVTEEFFERNASRTVESALNTLPQFVPSYTSTTNNPDDSGGNAGQANVSLRGLGTTATLVLMDGRRVIPANGDGVADLNILPASLIESVEIITGGASAVYGSDALAGVVNFKLKRDFDGVEIGGTWAQTDRGDGTQSEASLAAGTDFAGGRGSVMGFVAYADRDLVLMGDRDFSRVVMAYVGAGAGTMGPGRSFLPFGSAILEEGITDLLIPGNEPTEQAFDALMVSYGYAAGQIPSPHEDNWGFGFNTDGTLFTIGDPGFAQAGTPAVANFRGEPDPLTSNAYSYRYNFAPTNALQLPLERSSAFTRAEFELGDTARIFLQGLYTDYSATQQIAPNAVFEVYMPVDNPFIPDDLKVLLDSRPENPDADIWLAKRLSEMGPRRTISDYDVYQVTLGLTGSVLDGWKYEAYVQAGANDRMESLAGAALTSRIEELTYAPDGGVSICGGFDWFGRGSISRECLDYIAVDVANHETFDQGIAEVSFSGAPLALPAGDLRVVLGVFYKQDRYEYAASPVASVFVPVPGSTCPPDCRPDVQGFVASDSVEGDDHNIDIYAEVLVPLLNDEPGVRSLEAVLGYRLSDYASAGSFDSWKAELLYLPVDALRLRGSHQQAVRAPSVIELYKPQLPGLFNYFSFDVVLDPCDVESEQRAGPDAASVEALCIAHGVPPARLPVFSDPQQLWSGVAGGNPELGPEDAMTTTLGAVWTSPFSHPLLTSLQVSLDGYHIEIADKIDWVAADQFVPYCFDARYNPEFSPTNQWCRLFGRNPQTGRITDVQQLLQNAYNWETSGIDLQVDWRFDLGPGQLGVSGLASWLDSFEISVDDSSAAPTEYLGTVGRFGGSLPEWKTNLHVNYAWRDLTLGATWRYVDTMTDVSNPEYHVPGVNYFDLNASYEVATGLLAGLRLRVGVENLTDEDPPILADPLDANTDPSQYDVLGRRYYVSLNYSF
jgi:iron complex outermembrane recepter protein